MNECTWTFEHERDDVVDALGIWGPTTFAARPALRSLLTGITFPHRLYDYLHLETRTNHSVIWPYEASQKNEFELRSCRNKLKPLRQI
jgi:hypothetical protein